MHGSATFLNIKTGCFLNRVESAGQALHGLLGVLLESFLVHGGDHTTESAENTRKEKT